MIYFKNSELAKKYHISLGTVRNWIESAQNDKLSLQLYSEGERTYIANTDNNLAVIDDLIRKGRKFRNKRAAKRIRPTSKFYELYSQKQILDIISSIDIHREVPYQYSYFDGGADFWNQYASRLSNEDTPNFLNATVNSLNINKGYIDHLIADYDRVNIIDIGVGNALPVKTFVEHLIERGKLRRYIGLDISAQMLEIARNNLESWFGPKVHFEGHQVDINHDRFSELLTDELISESADKTINIVLVLGGTLVNMRKPDGALRTINGSMNRHDLMIYNLKLDSQSARAYFDFNVGKESPPLDEQAKMMLDMLNIDDSFYETEMGYEEQSHKRYMRIRLKIALTLDFEFENGKRSVELHKNDRILLWRYWHQTAPEVIRQLDQNDFSIRQTSQTENGDYILTISQVKSM